MICPSCGICVESCQPPDVRVRALGAEKKRLVAEVERLRAERTALLTHLERCVKAADDGDWFNDVEVWTPAEEAIKAAKAAGSGR